MTTKEMTTRKPSPVDLLKKTLNAPSVQEQFQNALKENSSLFVASLIDLYGNDKYLQNCDPNAVVMEALKAATLKLPINKGLGFAWLVPYNNVPQMQIGYRGYLQLAMRTGAYKHINADVIYEGELINADKLTGELDLSGQKKSEKVVGYFAFMETINGFRKTLYGSFESVKAHAEKYSKAYQKDLKKNTSSCPWTTDFDSMAKKTMIRELLGKYGMMSVDMVQALSSDLDEEKDAFDRLRDNVATNANQEIIDIDPKPETPEPDTAPKETGFYRHCLDRVHKATTEKELSDLLAEKEKLAVEFGPDLFGRLEESAKIRLTEIQGAEAAGNTEVAPDLMF